MIFCGPKVHRSTEYEMIISSHGENLKILKEPFLDETSLRSALDRKREVDFLFYSDEAQRTLNRIKGTFS